MKFSFLRCLLVALWSSASIFAQASLPTESLQAIVVTTKDWNATQGTAKIFARKSKTAEWKTAGGEFPVVVGKNGLAWSLDAEVKAETEPHKREGDGRSPAGIFALASAFGSSAKPNYVKLSYLRLTSAVECVDDAQSENYNLLVDQTEVAQPDWKSSEKMLAVGAQYDLGVFVAHNAKRQKSGGSCIFLHIWKDAATGTAGCTAMARADIEKTLAWLDAAKNPVLIQLPETVYDSYQNLWNLPKIK